MDEKQSPGLCVEFFLLNILATANLDEEQRWP